jgi:hypothetical protein
MIIFPCFINLKKLTMKKIQKIQNQIWILNQKIKEQKSDNLYALKNKVKGLKEKLKIEVDLYNWENYLSQ